MRFNTSRVRRSLRDWAGILKFLLFSIAVLIWLVFPPPLFSGGRQEIEKKGVEVFVSIPPQAYFTQRIGGDRLSVGVLVQEGQDPHTFDPTPSVLARLSEADLFFRIGVEFETILLDRIRDTSPDLRIIDCRENINFRAMDSSEEGHEHNDEGKDPHIWMSVRNAITISTTIYEALTEIDPDNKSSYQANYNSLVEELNTLDMELARILESVQGKKLFVFHPAFGYFADDYGLHQVAVEIRGNEPSARQLAGVIDEVKKQGGRVIFVQPQFSQKSAQAVADATGGAVVPIDSLALDYIANMTAVARVIEESIQ